MKCSIYTKWLTIATIGLIIIAVGCYLYYQQTTKKYRQDAAKSAQMIREWEASKKANAKSITKTEAADTQQSTSTNTPAERTTTAEEYKNNKTLDPKNNTTTEIENDNVPVKVSPYGFGPYPEVPPDFKEEIGTMYWQLPDEVFQTREEQPSRESELMVRVMIKLWKQGRTDVESAFWRDGRVIVNYRNRAYVTFDEITLPNGEKVPFLSSWRSGRLPAPPWNPRDPWDTGIDAIPPGVEIIDLGKVNPSLDPYEFLGLSR